MQKKDEIEITEEEQASFIEGLREAAMLKDQLETFKEEYEKLIQKYPQKSNSKYKS
ncbi:MAG: hypothetical protein KDI61_05665 [Alphaproteobacteria bacterium]|nr:hypothetical protein [Alphaproteobacteria bacterium]MCB1839731.1 hypothetical protein [Alphaproteobacteria bacterium]